MTAPTSHLPKDLPYDLRAAAEHGPVLRVVVGSRLHGFAHATSDHDAWVVVPEPRDHTATLASRKVFQGIETHEDGTVTDVTVVGLSTFLHHAAMGAPQALEVMWAPRPEVDRLGPMRQAFRADPNTARASYRRQVRRNILPRAAEPKQRRHGFRLALNLNTLLATGRFNPALTPDERAWVLDMAEPEDGFAARLESVMGMTLAA